MLCWSLLASVPGHAQYFITYSTELQRESLGTRLDRYFSWAFLHSISCSFFVLSSSSLPPRYDSKCDVWSIGCILYDMANNKNNFVYVSILILWILLLHLMASQQWLIWKEYLIWKKYFSCVMSCCVHKTHSVCVWEICVMRREKIMLGRQSSWFWCWSLVE